LRWQDYLILFMLIGGYFLYQKLKTGKFVKKQTSRRIPKLSKKEETALQSLQDKGYQLQDKRPEILLKINLDGKEKTVDHRSGFTVKKDGKSYLVKMKKENTSPLSSKSLRQELLLDHLLFQPAKIMLYNQEKKSFQELDFSVGEGHPFEKIWLKVALIVLIIIGVVFLVGLFFEGVLL